MKKETGLNTATIVTKLAEPIAKELNLTLWDVKFEKEGAMWILRVIIDKEGGVSVEDCEALSRPLDKKLDEVDPIEQSYCLEVSSAGLERELTKDWHFAHCKGEKVIVRLIRPYNNERDFIGELLDFVNDTVVVKTNTDSFQFGLSEVAYVRLYIDF